jgi:hypothetical protein
MQLYNQLKPDSVASSSSVNPDRSGRVRMEMMGGASGRRNMPAPLVTSFIAFPEVAAALE